MSRQPLSRRRPLTPPILFGSTLTRILLVAFLARMVSILVLYRAGFSEPFNEHWLTAQSLYKGQGFAFDWYGLYKNSVVGSFLPPIYAWTLYFDLLLTGGHLRGALALALTLNAILGTATVWLVARLAGFAWGERGGTRRGILRNPPLLAAAAWAIYPPALGHAAQPQSQTVETFLLVLLVFLLVRGLSTTGSGPGKGAPSFPLRGAPRTGLVLGLLLLARPTAAVLWAAWAGFLLWRRKGQRSLLRFFLIASAVAAVVLAPWTIRNTRVHHHLVPISTNGGFNFYMGNNPDSGGGIPPLVLFFTRMPEAEQEEWRDLSEVERDRKFYRMGLDFWRRDTGLALRGVGHRAISFVFFRPYLFAAYPPWLYVGFVASYLLLLIPFCLALPRCRGAGCSIPLIAVISTGLVSLAYVVSMRFRATVEPFMAVLGAGAVSGRKEKTQMDDPEVRT